MPTADVDALIYSLTKDLIKLFQVVRGRQARIGIFQTLKFRGESFENPSPPLEAQPFLAGPKPPGHQPDNFVMFFIKLVPQFFIISWNSSRGCLFSQGLQTTAGSA